jgi:hypothetical protein
MEPAPAQGARVPGRLLALERAQPARWRRAEALLASDAAPAEKVAFLRALGQSGSKERLRWLDNAARTLPDDSGPDGVSVASSPSASFRRRRTSGPRGARCSDVSPSRRAGSRRPCGAARHRPRAQRRWSRAGKPAHVSPARERDERLVAGVLAALRERPECARQAARLLTSFAPERESAPVAAVE